MINLRGARKRRVIERVHVDTDVERYMWALSAQRGTIGTSQLAAPRGALALLKLARTWAAMSGRDFVLPDDVKLSPTPHWRIG